MDVLPSCVARLLAGIGHGPGGHEGGTRRDDIHPDFTFATLQSSYNISSIASLTNFIRHIRPVGLVGPQTNGRHVNF